MNATTLVVGWPCRLWGLETEKSYKHHHVNKGNLDGQTQSWKIHQRTNERELGSDATKVS